MGGKDFKIIENRGNWIKWMKRWGVLIENFNL